MFIRGGGVVCELWMGREAVGLGREGFHGSMKYLEPGVWGLIVWETGLNVYHDSKDI